MEDNVIKFEVELSLDRKWASNHDAESLTEYLRERLNSSIGFRGQLKSFKLVLPTKRKKR